MVYSFMLVLTHLDLKGRRHKKRPYQLSSGKHSAPRQNGRCEEVEGNKKARNLNRFLWPKF